MNAFTLIHIQLRRAGEMALVLCTGFDPALMKTRQLILERAGHKVVTALDDSTILSSCRRHRFDVAVIGQTISENHKRQLMALIRERCPSAKVLELYRSTTGRVLEGADSWLEVPADVPKDLADRVTLLAQTSGQ